VTGRAEFPYDFVRATRTTKKALFPPDRELALKGYHLCQTATRCGRDQNFLPGKRLSDYSGINGLSGGGKSR
jgi:hypothetical protein